MSRHEVNHVCAVKGSHKMRTRWCLSMLLAATVVLAAGDALPEGYGLRILSEPLPGVPTAPASAEYATDASGESLRRATLPSNE